MLIGTMNHPSRNILDEIAWMADLGMEFLDMTLEPPGNPSWAIDVDRVRAALEKRKMPVVGHTAYYLPMASAFEEVRKAAVVELRRCARVFAALGAKWMNIHPDRYTPFHDRAFFIRRNIESLREVYEEADKHGIGIMIENLPGDFNNAQQMGELLDPLPWLGMHLDLGHANLRVPWNTGMEMLERWGRRLQHVHLHDNKGGHEDLHLPLGSGSLDLVRTVGALKQCGYDGTITLEVFTPDRHYLSYSAELLRGIWTNGKR